MTNKDITEIVNSIEPSGRLYTLEDMRMATILGINKGIEEVRNNLSEETIKKVINDFMAIYAKRDGGYEGIDNAVQRIKQHWNDE